MSNPQITQKIFEAFGAYKIYTLHFRLVGTSCQIIKEFYSECTTDSTQIRQN